MNNGPWSFDGLLVLRRWEMGMTTKSITFLSFPLWVQVWGLPFDLLLEEVGRETRNELGWVVKVNTKAFMSDQARFIRVRAEIPLDKPIHRGSSILNPEGDKIRIGYKYERLVGLYFQCGRFGHEAKECSTLRDPY